MQVFPVECSTQVKGKSEHRFRGGQRRREHMSVEENKSLVRRYFDEVWNKGNMDATREFIHAHLSNHVAAPGAPAGSEGIKQGFTLFRGVFPDLHATIDHLIAEADMVVAHWTATGTHKGGLKGPKIGVIP